MEDQRESLYAAGKWPSRTKADDQPTKPKYEWFNAGNNIWQPIDRLPYTWERELGILWRVAGETA